MDVEAQDDGLVGKILVSLDIVVLVRQVPLMGAPSSHRTDRRISLSENS
jgi:hypothetical protein